MTLIRLVPEEPFSCWSGVYGVARVQRRQALPGLYALELEDCSGSREVLYRAPMDESGVPRPPGEGGVVRVTVTRAQTAKGRWYYRVDALEPTGVDSTLRLLPHRFCPVPGLLERLYRLMDEAISRPALLRFLDRVFGDPVRIAPFVSIPASDDCHHVEPGGLLQHSLELVEAVGRVVREPDSGGLVRQGVLIGALFHDLGKVAPAVLGRTPFWRREHALLNKPLLEGEFSQLREEDSEAWQLLHYVFRVIEGSVDGNRIPEAQLIAAHDRYSAARDARRLAFRGAPEWRRISVLRPSTGGPPRIFYRTGSDAYPLEGR
ncbi:MULTISPECIES: TraI domain-containing protein [Halorhodospira]|uniref:TraI domain-containing protein n=1 Tax=Halorhodospira TaxID=85108 RepID=UPI001EE79175|nr:MULTISPECIES: TraI domain-containing protein [Halorhodospira]MCG5529085.1 TraI domain-containing protein [Halorhodospira halophila]MCG5543200.1 TraI domain-containing protein [Halorhodospira sp. 9628]